MSTGGVKSFFGARLKALRGETSQAELADALGVAQVDVWRWESGKILPRAERIEGIARFFGVTTGFLISPDGGISKPQDPSDAVLTYIAGQAGVDSGELLSRLIKKHGWAEAQAMKKEREASAQAEQAVGLASPVAADKTAPIPEGKAQAEPKPSSGHETAKAMIGVAVARAKKPKVGM